MHSVDILLPTFNGAKYIEELINSLLNQSHQSIKIHIRDDGSTDQTIQIIEKLAEIENRILIYKDFTDNLGLVSNIEYLLSLSHADYIMYCDQDDFWFDNKVELLLEQMLIQEGNLGAKTPILIHSDCYVTDENLNIISLFKADKPFYYGLSNSLFNYYVQGASAIFNKSLKKEITPFINNIYIHDRYTHLIAEITGFRFYLNLPLMLYRQHSSNLIGSSSLFTKIKNLFLKENFIFFHKQDRLLIETIYNDKHRTNKLLYAYLKMTSNNASIFEKIKIKLSYGIKMRFKELFIMLIKH